MTWNMWGPCRGDVGDDVALSEHVVGDMGCMGASGGDVLAKSAPLQSMALVSPPTEHRTRHQDRSRSSYALLELLAGVIRR